MLLSLLTKERGATVTEFTIGSAIALTAIMAFFSQFSISNSAFLRIQNLSSRDEVFFNLRRAGNDAQSLRQTRLKDPVFDACFMSGSMSGVTRCPAQQSLGITLYDRTGTPLAGPPETPVYYTVGGVPCAQASPLCRIAAIATVRAQGFPEYGTNRLVEIPWSTDKWRHEMIEVVFEVHSIDSQTLSIKENTMKGSVVVQVSDFGVTP